MCGIIGYIGKSEATGILIKGLKGLEYRGYDSGGIGVLNEEGLSIVKAAGEIKNLENKLKNIKLSGTLGIGHTRWATHGAANETNAHPQASRSFAVVHNGIIENYAELKESLIMIGFTFESDTDTEVIPKLLELNYTGNALEAIKKTLPLLKGSYALGIVCKNDPDTLYCAKNGSPLIIGTGSGENYISSDLNPLLGHISGAIHLEDGETARITAGEVTVFGRDFAPVKKTAQKIEEKHTAAGKDGFKHYMIKEIFEQPAAVAATLAGITGKDGVEFDGFPLTDEEIAALSRIYLIGCGSAYHVALMAKYAFEKIAKTPCFAEYAGEFRYQSPVLDQNCLVVIISQSGETADSLAALKTAREHGARTISIVNAPHSSIAKMSEYSIITPAGQEIAVATTKAFTCQAITLDMLCIYLALKRGACSAEFVRIAVNASRLLPEKIEEQLKNEQKIKTLAARISKERRCFFLGRNADYAAALEGALKLKEISYIDCAAYPASELKHGTISLIEEGTVCFGLISNAKIMPKTVSNMQEVISRGANVTLFAPQSLEKELSGFEDIITFPDAIPLLAPLPEVIAMQLLAYYTAKEKGLPIDKPRNLAKSVTVE